MMVLNKFLTENSLEQMLLAAGISALAILLTIIIKWITLRLLIRFARHTESRWDDGLVNLLRTPFYAIYLALLVYFFSLNLELPPFLNSRVTNIVFFLLILQGGIAGSSLLRFWFQNLPNRSGTDSAQYDSVTMTLIYFIARVVLWGLVAILLLDNLGFQVTTLVASLGVGGVAVALAVQNILGDLFASLSIALDKPFRIGDFIVVDELMGNVEHVGLKTTRIRSLSGEQLVFSNNDLLQSRIRNFQQMKERRVVFGFGVTYDTPADVVATIPEAVRRIIEETPSTRFDRAHFKDFGDSSLDFEVVYFVLDPDYNHYMDIHHKINIGILNHMNANRINFAFPTRSIYLEKQDC